MSVRVIGGDCLEAMRALAAEGVRVDAVVTDPPYHLISIVKRFGKDGAAAAQMGATGAYARASRGFMGKQWDGGDIAFRAETWALAMALLKPGGHLVAFSGTRTYHRMACAIEDAGFEIRDMLCWHYGSGFPKSHDVSKAIAALETTGGSAPRNLRQQRLGDDYAPTGQVDYRKGRAFSAEIKSDNRTAPLTPAARQWQGWGTALKPATEPIALARKPLSEKTIAANVLRWGTGGINVDGCRVGTKGARNNGRKVDSEIYGKLGAFEAVDYGKGRFPANLVHDGSPEVLAGFPQSNGQQGDVSGNEPSKPLGQNTYGKMAGRVSAAARGDAGSAARFFYCAKAGADDRFESRHPTVKPVELMRWLVRLVTPPGGLVLDPFAGTGTTGIACVREGRRAILIEREAEYQADIARRLKALGGEDTPLFGAAE